MTTTGAPHANHPSHADESIGVEQELASYRKEVNDATSVLERGGVLSHSRLATLGARRRDRGGIYLAALKNEWTPAVAGAEALLDARGVPLQRGLDAVLAGIAPLHAAVLEARPDAGAVLVNRSPHLGAWAVAGVPIPVRYFSMFGYTKAPEIPVVPGSQRGTTTIESVRAVLERHPHTPALLLSDGAVVIWAKSIGRTARLHLSLEEAAQVTALAERLGGAKEYPVGLREAIHDAITAHGAGQVS